MSLYRTDLIAQTILEHTFSNHGQCVCGYVGHGPASAAEHVARQVEQALADEGALA